VKFTNTFKDGIGIVNADDAYAKEWKELLRDKMCLTLGSMHLQIALREILVFDAEVGPFYFM